MVHHVIRTDNLSRQFNGVLAVDSLSMEVPKGIVFGFLGPNGSGKTTTIRLLLGLLEPTLGRAEVLGFDTCKQADRVREASGALLEHSGLYERLSAEDNLDLFGRIWRLPAQERRARVKQLLTHMDLWERRGEKVGTWSRGMKQKLAVARALMHRPAIVFLDEPTSGLDPVASVALREDIKNLAANEGVTVFLTTHNLVEAERVCSMVGVIRKGRLIAFGHPDQLRSQASGVRVKIMGRGIDEEVLSRLRARQGVVVVETNADRLTVDLPAEASVAPLVKLLVGAGVQVEEVRKGKASLEDAFLSLMEEEP